jgi:hypothetical protein
LKEEESERNKAMSKKPKKQPIYLEVLAQIHSIDVSQLTHYVGEVPKGK